MKTRLTFISRYDCGTPTLVPCIEVGHMPYRYRINAGKDFGLERTVRAVVTMLVMQGDLNALMG